MMWAPDFDTIEARRELADGLAYEEHRERAAIMGDEDGYDPADPKHPCHHGVYADVWDMRDKTEGLA